MPPLFLYALAFLAVLTVVTFVLCRRDEAGATTQAARADAAPAHPVARPGGGAVTPLRPMPAGSGPLLAAPGSALRRTAAPAAAIPVPGLPEAAALDRLGLQVADLTRQVAALQAERQTFQDEIRRLRLALADAVPAAPVRSLKPVRVVESGPRLQRFRA